MPKKSPDVKAEVKQQEIKELVAVSFLVLFIRSNLKYNVPSGMYFSFNFAWDFIQLGLFF